MEYLSSEEERRKRNLEVSLKHPDIDLENENLDSHIRNFMSSRLKMEPRSIDSGLKTQKNSRNGSVKIMFSNIRFKRFLFGAKKKLRENSDDANINLFVNENLTSYNYSILKEVKEEHARRKASNLNNFFCVYSFDGKVYVKMSQSDERDAAIYLQNTKKMTELFARLEGTSDGNSQ